MTETNRPRGSSQTRRPEAELRLGLDATSPIPLYLQIAAQLKYLIATGELGPGTRLPSARHLALDLKVNRNTVLQTYASLSRCGYVKGSRGRGTVVSVAGYKSGPLTGNLIALLDALLTEASSLGFAADDTAALVTSHARLKPVG
jgi:DNA-binding transcriptional regulator YhcF (GntR family)